MFKKFRKILTLTFLFAILSTGTHVEPFYAAEKSIVVPVEQSFDSLTFKASFEEEGEYRVSIESPSGERFEFTHQGNNLYACTINNITPGSWILHVEDDTKLSIGKVYISASIPESDPGIEIGRDIVGLKVYFKNNKLVAEWTDDTCKSVSFTVTNLDNSFVIAKGSSSTKYYECELADNIKNISVSITPSKMNGIAGKTATYTMERKPNIQADVVFPSKYYTNASSVSIGCTLSKTYGIVIEVNGNVVLRQENTSAGEYTLSVPLESEGENFIQVFFVDEKGNMYSKDASFNKDITYPTLSLDSAYDGMSVDAGEFLISGTVSGHSSFSINGEEVHVDNTGKFSYTCTLVDGNNLYSLLAKDDAGNEVFYNINLMVNETSSEAPGYLLPVIAIVILLFVFMKKPSHKRKKPQNLENNDDSQENVPTEEENVDLGPLNASEDISIYLDKDNNPEKAEINASAETDSPSVTQPVTKDFEPQEDIVLKTEEKSEPGKAPESIIELREKKKKKKGSSKLMHWFRALSNIGHVFSIIFYFLLFTVLFQVIIYCSYVPTSSMEPKIEEKSVVVFNRLAYVQGTPSYGDVIAFEKDETIYCKRIVGVSGDEIKFYNGYVYRNGEKVEEYYLDSDVETNSMKTFVVPDGCLFVLGDNRENSYDSRFWEKPYVAVTDIKGKYLFSFKLPWE